MKGVGFEGFGDLLVGGKGVPHSNSGPWRRCNDSTWRFRVLLWQPNDNLLHITQGRSLRVPPDGCNLGCKNHSHIFALPRTSK